MNFRSLYPIFAELPGWEMRRPTGERLLAPLPITRASVRYHKQDSQVEASITDSAFHQEMLAPYASLAESHRRERDDGYERSTMVFGHKGWERWQTGGQGELGAIVGGRFLVQFVGRKLDDTNVLWELAEATNLEKLAQLE